MDIIAIPGFSEPFSSISHLGSAGLSLIAAFLLVYRGRGNSGRVLSLLIYSFSLIFLFSMSGVYHLLEKGNVASYVLQILDYAGIYTLIAGSFTPIHFILFRGLRRWPVILLVWTLGITGLTLTAIFFKSIPEWLNLTFFLSMGWIGLYTLWNIFRLHSKQHLKYLLAGALFYSVGAIIEFARWPIVIPGVIETHEVFHIFVMLGAYSHWRLIFDIAGKPISSKVTIIVREFSDESFRAQATSENAIFEAKTLDGIKHQVMAWVKSEFHQEMLPKLINYKYFKEENIHLEK